MEPKESLKEYEILDGTPTWAIALFDKMKAEICAEVHAKVAYTVRIMLDQMGEDIKASVIGAVLSSSSANEATVAAEVCPCRDPRKCRSCIEKRLVLRQAHRIQKQEEKMLSKMAYKESKMAYKESKKLRKNKFLKSSGTESETDKQTPKQPTPCCTSRPPPVPPRKILPPDVVQAMTEVKPSASSQSASVKVAEDKPCELQEEPMQTRGSNIYEPDGCVFDFSVQTKEEEVPSIAPSPVKAEAQPCPSDSEFEVVSMPAVQTAGEFVRVLDDDSLLLSDDDNDDSSSSSNDNDSEAETTEIETKINAECKGQLMMTETTQLADSDSSKAGSLYPELELKKMTLSMVSSSTSTSTVLEYMSSCSTEDVGPGDQEAGAVGGLTFIERQRTPYSIAPDVVEKLNDAEVVHSQPLPSEFLRERNPYSQVLWAEQKDQKPSARSPPPTTKEPQPSPSPPTRPQQPTPPQRPKPPQQPTAPTQPKPPQQSGDPKYRVDHLPESLWDEALTVAAQTYNAAKTAVENLADTFVPVVPGVERGIPVQAPITTSPPPNQSTRGISSVPSQQTPMTKTEKQLYEMGFTNRTLNATLIARHKGDIEKIVADLIDP